MLGNNVTYIGDRIKEVRENSGLSQAQIAELAKVKRSTVAKIESGGQRPPVDFVSHVVKHCNTTYEYLFDNKKSIPKVEGDENQISDGLRKAPRQSVIIDTIHKIKEETDLFKKQELADSLVMECAGMFDENVELRKEIVRLYRLLERLS